jgi:excisionase family DNA binding protein
MSTKNRISLNEEHKSGSQAASVEQTEKGLLQCYLDLPPNERSTQFAEVSRAAMLTGVSPRTIQRWAKQRRIRAIFIAEKYQVEIKSLYGYIEQRAWSRGN